MKKTDPAIFNKATPQLGVENSMSIYIGVQILWVQKRLVLKHLET